MRCLDRWTGRGGRCRTSSVRSAGGCRVRFAASPNATLEHLARAVASQLAEARTWQDFAPEVATPYGFTYRTNAPTVYPADGVFFREEPGSDQLEPHAVAVAWLRAGGDLHLRVVCDAHLYRQEEARRIADLFVRFVDRACSNRRDLSLDGLSFMPEPERARILDTFANPDGVVAGLPLRADVVRAFRGGEGPTRRRSCPVRGGSAMES